MAEREKRNLLQLIITEHLREQLAQKARENGLSLSSYVRYVLTNLMATGAKNGE
jgi:predicted HicB family RNase H-like nuclease